MNGPPVSMPDDVTSEPSGPGSRVRVARDEVWVDGLRLGTTTVTPTGEHDSSPIIVTLGILAKLDTFEEQRFWLLADRLRRPVIALDTPGWTVRGGGLPHQVRRRLRRGGFDWLAHLLGDVVLRTNPGVLDLAPSVVGYSLGASTGSALAADITARGADLRGLSLIEPVAVRRQSLVELAWRNLRDARHSHRYAVENKDLAWAVSSGSRLPWPRAIELSLLVWAISRGHIPETVAGLPAKIPVTLVSGERSTLAPLPAIDRLAIGLRRSGHPVDQHTIPDAHHALWNSLAVVDRIADWIV